MWKVFYGRLLIWRLYGWSIIIIEFITLFSVVNLVNIVLYQTAVFILQFFIQHVDIFTKLY